MTMPTQKPTLKQLEYFVAIANAKTFRRAAEKLSVSQPTLSAQIYSLEQILELSLLERSRSGAVLTPAGRDLLPQARQIIDEMKGLIDQAQMIRNGPSGTYKLGVSPTVGPYLLPHILADLHHSYAHLKFYVRENMPDTLKTDLLEGRIDLVLTPLPFSGSKIEVVPLFEEPMRLIIPAEHEFTSLKSVQSQKSISKKRLLGENILTLESKYHSYHQVEIACQNIGAHILRDYEGTSLDALRQMAVTGMGLAFLPNLYIHTELHKAEGLKVIDIKDMQLSRNHILAWRKQSPNRGFYRKLAQSIQAFVKTNLNDAGLIFSE